MHHLYLNYIKTYYYNNNMTHPPKELQDILEKINETCILLANRDNLDVKFTKLDFLEEKGFYNKYDPKMFL
jgi:hypothetical protein